MKDKIVNKQVRFIDKGQIAYKDGWDFQQSLFDEITNAKRQMQAENSDRITSNYLIFCHHNHVYTLGKSGSSDNLLLNHLQLQAKDAEFFQIDRGGDITYHGPGQLVGYPILNLEYFVTGIRDYIDKIEESVIRFLADYGILAERLDGATGVWLDTNKPTARKICAIGVRTSRWVSMHGFALNVNTNLDYFSYINPCGITDKAVTSMEKELGKTLDMDEVKQNLLVKIADVFQMEIIS